MRMQILHRILHALKKRGKHGLVVGHLPVAFCNQNCKSRTLALSVQRRHDPLCGLHAYHANSHDS